MSKPSGVELIAAERRRQVEEEGWSVEHDAEHPDGALALAAAVYAMPPGDRETKWLVEAKVRGEPYPVFHQEWARPAVAAFPWASKDGVPRLWGAEHWKPCPDDRVRELVKAGALIAAEIDRLVAATGAGA